ncbi:MAG: L-glutamate gamma-semialdehyde dehydrogenase [Planctomycetota bacterium]
MFEQILSGTHDPMHASSSHALRCLEIGQEIFERAHAAEPQVWQQAWWARQANDYLLAHERLKVQLFRFIDTLPALHTEADVARHLKEYLRGNGLVVPKPLQLALSFDSPDTLLARIVARFTRFAAHEMAGTFITGSNAAEAIATALRLRARKMAFTIDVLGEATTNEAQADKYAQTYLDLVDVLGREAPKWQTLPLIDQDRAGPMPRANVSIKLTALDPNFDPIDPVRSRHNVCRRLRPILRRAQQVGAMVNIDMESYKVRDLTLDIFMTLLNEPEFRDWPHAGIVVQAYLQDGEHDLARLLEWVRARRTPIAIRLVKGAYWDSETVRAIRHHARIPVWTQKWQSDVTYEGMARTMLEHYGLIRPAFASHNVRSLASVMASAEELNLTPADYEVQMLYGMGDPLKTALVQMGQCVRVYCPYGELVPGMGYLIRRLLENTCNDSFLRQSFGDQAGHLQLLQDPDVTRPPSAPLPARHYVDIDSELPMSSFKNLAPIGFGAEADRKKMKAALEHVRSEFGKTYPLLIDGQKVVTEQWMRSTNPSKPSETIGRVALATIADAEQAIGAAARVFEAWSHTTAADRAHMLTKAADLIEQRRFELTALICFEVGKPWREADADLCEAVDYIRYYAEQSVRMEERPRRRNVPGEDNLLIHEPCGIAAMIGPWNFPLAILAGMTTAALATGNCVIVKPSRHASVTAARFADILAEGGVPPGVIAYLPGHGEVVGDYLVKHPQIHVVAFTGSRDVGLEVVEAAAVVRPGQDHFKKIMAEMGGKNAIIVDDDCNVDDAVTGIIQSAFACAGQKCTGCSRAIVLAPVYDNFCKRLVEAAKCVVIGPATEPGTVIGPVIDEPALELIREYVEVGKQEGRLLLAIEPGDIPGGGHYVGPTIFADVPPNARIAQEEIFGPVLALIRADDFRHAIRIANSTRYALTGGVYSRSPAHIDYARREFKVGNLYINRKITGSQVDLQPFGGFKLSGAAAQAGGPNYLYQFCQARTICENTLRTGFAPTEAVQEPVY